MLDGGGDSFRFTVSQATWDWINSDYPNFLPGETSIMEELPDAVMAEIPPSRLPQMRMDYGCPEGENISVMVTCGSCDNDRAIMSMEWGKYVDLKQPSEGYAGIYEGYVY